MDVELDISSLKRAYESYNGFLNEALLLKSKDYNSLYMEEIIRSGVIHQFEMVYELAWKSMERYIEMDVGSVNTLTRKGLFRLAAEKELITDFDKWVEFHEARNKSTHVYDENIAEKVYAIAVEFKPYLENFINVLEERLKS
ncbi:MAG: nucleotidyltransferase substrate binding protein [Methanobrevibacter sp.]|nr:nucleotidyltransferase substrate binding protein [Candidatus Methanovirga aequatorialis]